LSTTSLVITIITSDSTTVFPDKPGSAGPVRFLPPFDPEENLLEQGVALTGRNRTGPPCNVGHPTAHAPKPAAADRLRARRPARLPAALQTTTDDEQYNTGLLRGPVISDREF